LGKKSFSALHQLLLPAWPPNQVAKKDALLNAPNDNTQVGLKLGVVASCLHSFSLNTYSLCLRTSDTELLSHLHPEDSHSQCKTLPFFFPQGILQEKQSLILRA
jgi:hypothetical protein